MSPKKARKLRNCLAVAGMFLIVLATLWEPFVIIGLIVTFTCLIPELLFNKCDQCGRHLGRNSVDYYQYCGHRLKD